MSLRHSRSGLAICSCAALSLASRAANGTTNGHGAHVFSIALAVVLMRLPRDPDPDRRRVDELR